MINLKFTKFKDLFNIPFLILIFLSVVSSFQLNDLDSNFEDIEIKTNKFISTDNILNDTLNIINENNVIYSKIKKYYDDLIHIVKSSDLKIPNKCQVPRYELKKFCLILYNIEYKKIPDNYIKSNFTTKNNDFLFIKCQFSLNKVYELCKNEKDFLKTKYNFLTRTKTLDNRISRVLSLKEKYIKSTYKDSLSKKQDILTPERTILKADGSKIILSQPQKFISGQYYISHFLSDFRDKWQNQSRSNTEDFHSRLIKKRWVSQPEVYFSNSLSYDKVSTSHVQNFIKTPTRHPRSRARRKGELRFKLEFKCKKYCYDVRECSYSSSTEKYLIFVSISYILKVWRL